MNTKHTPGPWNLESGPHKTATGAPADWSVTCSKGIVAMLIDDDTVGPRYERDANAALIAAAPELLSVVKTLLFFVETYGGEVTANIEAALPIYRAILAKAEGK